MSKGIERIFVIEELGFDGMSYTQSIGFKTLEDAEKYVKEVLNFDSVDVEGFYKNPRANDMSSEDGLINGVFIRSITIGQVENIL